MMIKLYLWLLCLATGNFFSQDKPFFATEVVDSLRQNANSIVRLHQADVTIKSQQKMSIKTHRVVTVLNENGLSAIDAAELYNNN